MRRVALLSLLSTVALWATPDRAGACDAAAPCLDAEPLWLSAAARHWSSLSDTGSLRAGEVAGGLSVGFRLKPLVLVAPAPNAAGREINLILHTTDLTAGVRVGVGERMELTLVVPAGLYQRGAGIKGVTHQTAPAIDQQSLHDPRVGFGYALPGRLLSRVTLKVRFELKLPLGDQAALMGDESLVASPTVAAGVRSGGWFGGAELGFRFRQPSDFFGRRVATQLYGALGLGYELPHPRLAFSLEAYALRSLQPFSEGEQTLDVAAESLAGLSFTPRSLPRWSFGLSGGTNLPLTNTERGWSAGLGTPLLRLLTFARFTPAE